MRADLPTLDDLSQRLREYLRARGLKQREAARLFGIPQSTLSRLLDGRDILYSTGTELVAKLNAHEAARKPLGPNAVVTDVMTRPVRGIDPSWSLARTQKFLSDRDYTHAPLVTGAHHYGDLISRRKVSDALAAGTPPQTPLSLCKNEITDGPPGYVKGDDNISILPEQLRWRPLLLVLSQANRVKGVVTRANLSLLPSDASVNRGGRGSNTASRR